MSSQTARRQMEILLVEDNPGDVRLTEEALRGSEGQKRLHIAKDGVEAMAFLFRKRNSTSAPYPDLILLDLNLPKKGGSEVLAEIKKNPKLRHIPVVILTSSEEAADIIKAYDLHANCYVTKPMDLEQFIAAVKSIINYWFTVASLPVEEMKFD